MLLRIQAPAAPLNGLVESLSLVIDPAYPYLREQVLPDGAVDLLIRPPYGIKPSANMITRLRELLHGLNKR